MANHYPLPSFLAVLRTVFTPFHLFLTTPSIHPLLDINLCFSSTATLLHITLIIFLVHLSPPILVMHTLRFRILSSQKSRVSKYQHERLGKHITCKWWLFHGTFIFRLTFCLRTALCQYVSLDRLPYFSFQIFISAS